MDINVDALNNNKQMLDRMNQVVGAINEINKCLQVCAMEIVVNGYMSDPEKTLNVWARDLAITLELVSEMMETVNPEASKALKSEVDKILGMFPSEYPD